MKINYFNLNGLDSYLSLLVHKKEADVKLKGVAVNTEVRRELLKILDIIEGNAKKSWWV